MSKKPNVIIVMTDQQRADLRKSRGYELDTMPFLDQWAKGGVDFASAFASNPTCTPSRVSMLTGRYSECHHVRTNHNVKDAYYEKDLLDVLKNAGYETALCGKNHSHRQTSDFDYAAPFGHLGYEGETNNTDEERSFADFLRSTGHLEVDYPTPGGVEVQHPYRIISSAFDFIDHRDNKTPFFMWMSFPEPHNPFQVPEPYFDMFPPEKLPSLHGTKEDLKNKSEKFQWLRKVWEDVLGPDEEQINHRILRSRSNYLGMLRLIDDQFKRFVTGLKERGLEEDTLIIYLSDHGDFGGEYELIRKGPELPDLLCRVPFIWRGPGVNGEREERVHFANIVDILPTLCDLLQIEVPFGVQGKSLLPILENKDIPEKEFDVAYSESGFSGMYWNEHDKLTLRGEGALEGYIGKQFDCLNTWTQCGQVRAIWKGDYHLQMDMMEEGYLYNVSTDPFELTNLWENKSYQEVKMSLMQEMIGQILKNADPLPAPHNRYRTKVHPKGYWYQDYVSNDPGVRK